MDEGDLGGPRPGALPRGVLQRLAHLAHAAADRTALVDLPCATVFTHAALAQAADEVARGLDGAGVRPGTVVGLALPEGALLWCAFLGVLQAGCAVAPLRAREAPRVLAAQAQAAGAVLLLCGDAAAAPDAPMPTTTLDALRACAAQGARRPLPPDVAVATVMGTSGSTGQPKCVEVPRRALDAVVEAFASPDLLGGRRSVLSVTGASFDIAFLEVIGAMCCGAAVVLAPEGARADGRALAQLLGQWGADAMQTTPSTWARLMDAGFAGAPGFLALCGGEAAPPRVAAWLAGLPGRALNVYGPTETAVWSAAGPMQGRPGGEALGRALPGETLHVLDEALRSVAPGGVGQLFIGGIGLAHGYRGAPALTARAFLPDPSGPPGARMYATGDRVQLDARGDIVFRGREDTQVKMHGVRLELDGIARRLAQCPAVTGCVVLLAEDAGRGPVLVAYLCLAPHAADRRAALVQVRRYAREHLPEHALPSGFVVLDSFPETPTGKIDRARLPPVQPAHFEAPHAPGAPRTPTEAAVAAIWAETLGSESFGMEDDFFALGGRSLDATVVTAAVAERLLPGFGPEHFLDEPTVAAVARCVEAGGTDTGLPRPAAGTPGHRVPLSPIFALRVAQDLSLRRAHALNVRQALRLKGPFRPAAFLQALRALTARHDALRASIGLDDQGLYIQAAPPGQLAPDVTSEDLSGMDAQALAGAVALFLERDFDLRRAPALRFGLFRTGPDETVLAAAGSHLMLDGWSLAVLARELGALYREAVQPGSSGAPAAPCVQLPDVVAWQWELLRSPAFADSLAHWVGRIAPPRAPVFASAAADSAGAVPLRREFGAAAAARLEAAARALRCTPFTCFVACLLRAVRQRTGAGDLAVLLPAANRVVPELAGTVGMLMNPVLVRVALGDEAPAQTVAAVWREIHLAHRHQACPVDFALDALARMGRAPAAPPAEIHLLWNEASLAGLDLPDVEILPLPVPDGALQGGGADAAPLVLEVTHARDRLHVECAARTDASPDGGANRIADLLAAQFDALAAACGADACPPAAFPIT